MFLDASAHPTKLKHYLYIIFSVLLGICISFIITVGAEFAYFESPGNYVIRPVLQWGLHALGAIGGFFIGKLWWNNVYVNRKWAKKFTLRKQSNGK